MLICRKRLRYLIISQFYRHMKKLVITTTLLSLCLLVTSPAIANTDKQTRIEKLKLLEFEDLFEVEIRLDDVFDIFDGLVQAQKVSVATGLEQDSAIAPAVTTVITAQDIEAMGARSLGEALRMVPGISFRRNSQYRQTLIIRGVYSISNAEALLLINGVPLKSLADSGLGEWTDLPTQNIARIEVIRGPGSAVYGADAFAGVINIITQSADTIDGTETGLRIGSYNTYDLWALHGKQYGDWKIAIAMEYQNTEGPDEQITADSATLLDAQLGTQTSYAPGELHTGSEQVNFQFEAITGHWRFNTRYHGLYDEEQAITALVLDPNSTSDFKHWQNTLTWRDPNLTEHWDVTAQLSYSQQSDQGDNLLAAPNARDPNGVITRNAVSERQTYFNTSAFYRGFDQHILRLGGGYSYQEVYKVMTASNRGIDGMGNIIPPGSPLIDLTDTESALYPEEDRKNWHVFLQDSWQFHPVWELTLGLRYDDYSDFGNTTNPRAALVWQTTSQLTSKLLYGQAFLAPSFDKLYIRGVELLAANSDLKPEEIETWELAFDYRITDSLYSTLNLFRYEVTDRIQLVAVPERGLFEYQNVGQWEASGLEFETRWKMGAKASLLFNYAYVVNEVQSVENASGAAQRAADYDIGNYPRHVLYLRADWMVMSNWYLNGQLNWEDKRRRLPNDSRSALSATTTVDLTLRRKDIRNNHWNFAVGVRNLFNEDVRHPQDPQVPDDLPLPERNWFAELRYRF